VTLVIVIPGRDSVANPEPMNTDFAGTQPTPVAKAARSVFMGSGPSAMRCPGMTDLEAAG